MDKLENQIAFEKQMLENWESGSDTSLQPEGWTVENQLGFVRGMEHAKSIIEQQ